MDAQRDYLPRVVDRELDELFVDLPAVHLDGPKGVGKTATARRRARTVRDLDDDAQLAVVTADPRVIRADERPVLIDEWHRLPSVWDAVRRAVDDDPAGGQWLLAGSAPLRGTHSGAGRIVSLRMRPMCLSERGVVEPTVSFGALVDRAESDLGGRSTLTLADYASHITSGGFPGMRSLTGRALEVQLDSYLERLVDRDLPELGHSVRRPATLLRWLRAYAAATGTTASLESIRAAAGDESSSPARNTASTYSELLTTLRILDPVPAWAPTNNQLRRIAGLPKHHLVDPALAARLLGWSTQHLLSGAEPEFRPSATPLFGRLFESLATLSVRTYAQAVGAQVHHLRTRDGRREVDLIVETSDGRVLAIEVKLSANVKSGDLKHLHWLREQLGPQMIDAIVITTGPEAYRSPDGIGVVPLALLGP